MADPRTTGNGAGERRQAPRLTAVDVVLGGWLCGSCTSSAPTLRTQRVGQTHVVPEPVLLRRPLGTDRTWWDWVNEGDERDIELHRQGTVAGGPATAAGPVFVLHDCHPVLWRGPVVTGASTPASEEIEVQARWLEWREA